MSTRYRSRGLFDGPLPVGVELASDHRGESEDAHVEAREGCTNTTWCGIRLVDLEQGCEVKVKIPSVPEWALMSPGPGVPLKERWGWKPLLHTLTSGIWVLPGALLCVCVFRCSGIGWWLGRPWHLPHSVGGASDVRLPMLVLVRARHSYRAAYWTADFSTVVQCVEGSRTDVTLLC